jgi:hypothetical protein
VDTQQGRPDCYGRLEKVFPVGEEGLRQVPPGCLECQLRVDCMKKALGGLEGLEFQAERVEGSAEPGIIKRAKLWSLRKEIERKKREEAISPFSWGLVFSILLSPWRFFGEGGPEGKTQAFSFGLFWGSVGSMLAYFYQALAIKLGMLHGPGFLVGDLEPKGIFVALILFVPLSIVIEILISSVLWHLMLSLVGAGKSGLGATFRVVGSSQAVMILGLIPVVGGYLAIPWKFWVQMVGMKQLHQTSYGRIVLGGVLAVLGLLGLVVLLVWIFLTIVTKGLLSWT